MSCGWRVEEFVRYRETRFPAALYLPLALFLVAGGLSAGDPATGLPALGLRVVAGFPLACSLLLQFRLWDDLADVRRDRLEHPRRVLPRSRSPGRFRRLLLALFLLNLGWIAACRPPAAVAIFLLLCGCFCGWYSIRDRLPGWLAGHHVVLLKYPALVYLLGVEGPSRTRWPAIGLAMAVTYFCFCVYEILHDPGFRPTPATRLLLAGEMLALVGLGALMAADLGRSAQARAFLQVGLTMLGLAVLALVFRRYGRRTDLGPWRYALFPVCFTWLLNYAQVGPLTLEAR